MSDHESDEATELEQGRFGREVEDRQGDVPGMLEGIERIGDDHYWKVAQIANMLDALKRYRWAVENVHNQRKQRNGDPAGYWWGEKSARRAVAEKRVRGMMDIDHEAWVLGQKVLTLTKVWEIS